MSSPLKRLGERGVEVDEGSAPLVQGAEAEVVGGPVMQVDARPGLGGLLTPLVPPGRYIDLARRP